MAELSHIEDQRQDQPRIESLKSALFNRESCGRAERFLEFLIRAPFVVNWIDRYWVPAAIELRRSGIRPAG